MASDKKQDDGGPHQLNPSVVVDVVASAGEQKMEQQQQQQRGAKRSRPSSAKERISKMPPCSAGKRSSIYRGVTRHRWTGRYEAHLWDKSTWNHNQNKKGKQVYLGAYDEEEAAARAYDLAALKYWGPGTLINFPVSDYSRDIEEMKNVSREDYLAGLRRKSSGFSRSASKLRGNSRHHPGNRWHTHMGKSCMSNLSQLVEYGMLGDVVAGAGRSALEYQDLPLINLCNFMNWLQPPELGVHNINHATLDKSNKLPVDTPQDKQDLQRSPGEETSGVAAVQELEEGRGPWQPYQLPLLGFHKGGRKKQGLSALSLLSKSSMFQKMQERVNAAAQRQKVLTEDIKEEQKGGRIDLPCPPSAIANCLPCSSSSSGEEEKHTQQYELNPRLVASYSPTLPVLPPLITSSMEPCTSFLADQWHPLLSSQPPVKEEAGQFTH